MFRKENTFSRNAADCVISRCSLKQRQRPGSFKIWAQPTITQSWRDEREALIELQHESEGRAEKDFGREKNCWTAEIFSKGLFFLLAILPLTFDRLEALLVDILREISIGTTAPAAVPSRRPSERTIFGISTIPLYNSYCTHLFRHSAAAANEKEKNVLAAL